MSGSASKTKDYPIASEFARRSIGRSCPTTSRQTPRRSSRATSPSTRPIGYGKWHYGPGLPAEKRLDLMPAGYTPPTAASSREARALLRDHRHPRHRQGVAGAAAGVRHPRWQPRGLLGSHALHAARARRGRPDDQRDPRERPVRLRRVARRRVRQHAVQRAALVHRRARRQEGQAGLGRCGRPRSRTAQRLPGRVPGGRAHQRDSLVPGPRQPRPLLDGLDARQRQDPRSARRYRDPQHGRHHAGPPRRRQHRLLRRRRSTAPRPTAT